jgi:hypothetical protein
LLEVSMGKPQTPERRAMNAADLADLPEELLGAAFARARRECIHFPSVKELRELALGAEGDIERAEAEAAWQWVEQYVKRHGVDGKPWTHLANPSGYLLCEVCVSGWLYERDGMRRCPCMKQTVVPAPEIPERIEYALRAIGGIRRMLTLRDDGVPNTSYDFVKRDFAAAYKAFGVHELAEERFSRELGSAGGQKQLTAGEIMRPLAELVKGFERPTPSRAEAAQALVSTKATRPQVELPASDRQLVAAAQQRLQEQRKAPVVEAHASQE